MITVNKNFKNMKQSIFILFFTFLSTININAQEGNSQFVKSFTKVSLTNEKGEFEIPELGKNIFVFNYEGSDIKFYKANGENEILTRTSEIKKDKTKDGREYQWNNALDEKGNELIFVLYNDDEVRMLYQDKSSGSTIFAISFSL